MTITETMDNVAAYLRPVLEQYNTEQPSGTLPVKVYAGFPPVRTSASERESFVYALVLSAADNDDDDLSTATVEIGCSIYDSDPTDGWRALANVMEHIRQALLTHRTIAHGRNRLELPLKLEIIDEQPYPQWQGKLTATYTIGQPYEEIDPADIGMDAALEDIQIGR